MSKRTITVVPNQQFWDDMEGMTVRGFCKYAKISLRTYYKIKKLKKIQKATYNRLIKTYPNLSIKLDNEWEQVTLNQ